MRVRRVDAPFVDPIVAATTVDLVDGSASRMACPAWGGSRPTARAAVRGEHRHAHVETLVVGGGAAGVTEANAAAATGDRVDAGRVARVGCPGGEVVARRRRCSRARPRSASTTTATCVIHQRSRPVERVWHVRAPQRGARDRRARAAHRVRRQRPARRDAGHVRAGRTSIASAWCRASAPWCSRRTTPGHDAAFALADAGVEIAAIVDVGTAGGPATDAARARGIDVRGGWAVTGTDGRPARLRRARRGTGRASGRRSTPTCCSSPAAGTRSCSSGARSAAASATTSRARASSPTAPDRRWLSVVGAAAGDGCPPSRAVLVHVPPTTTRATYVDIQRDQTVADVLDAVEHDLRSVEHVKRATYIGTAIDQGRTSGVLTAAIVNQALGRRTRTRRARRTPVRRTRRCRSRRSRAPTAGHLFDPARVTPIHAVARRRAAPRSRTSGSGSVRGTSRWTRPSRWGRAVLREGLAVRTRRRA